jgi:hypothetical protein
MYRFGGLHEEEKAAPGLRRGAGNELVTSSEPAGACKFCCGSRETSRVQDENERERARTSSEEAAFLSSMNVRYDRQCVEKEFAVR